jgi:hypothetical protein
MCASSVILQKKQLLKENNHPMVENSPNQATLLFTHLTG